MRKQTETVRMIERALAFAHAALEEPTPRRVAESKQYAALVLPLLARADRSYTLGEGSRIVELVGQLRAVLAVIDRKMDAQTARGATN